MQTGTADCDTEDVHAEGGCVREVWGGRPPGGEGRHGQGRFEGQSQHRVVGAPGSGEWAMDSERWE